MNGWPKLWSGSKSLATFGWNFMKVSGLGFPCCHITMQRAKSSEQVRKCRACLYLVLFFLLLTLTRVGRQQYQSLSVFSCCGYCFVPALFCRHTPRQLPDVSLPLLALWLCVPEEENPASLSSQLKVFSVFFMYIFFISTGALSSEWVWAWPGNKRRWLVVGRGRELPEPQ